MTNEELQKLERAYIKHNTADIAELGIWASKSYIDNRRAKEMVKLIHQHDFLPELWVVEHEDGTEGIYINSELTRNTRSE